MQSVLGIDLGLSWRSTGSAVLSFAGDLWLSCTLGPIVWPETECDPASIASSIIEFALTNRVAAVGLDGPQGWRDPLGAGTFVGRECERLTRTPGKTGAFGISIPGTWIRWIQSSIQVFDALLESGHAVLVNCAEEQLLPLPPEGSFYVLECFPTSTWRSAGLQSLPGHHIDLPTVWRFAQNLQTVFGLPDLIAAEFSLPGSEHDDLQALVAGLPAAGLLGGPCRAIPRGHPGHVVTARDGIPAHRAEGLIWDAIPRRTSSVDLPHTNLLQDLAPKTIPAANRYSLEEFSKSVEPSIDRGVCLFTHLAEEANKGRALGISYGSFIAYMHGVAEFREVEGRNFRPSDAGRAVRLAWKVTEAAGGRKTVVRGSVAIDSGMDTFIWNAAPPFNRPDGAWRYPLPYTRQKWLSVFPHGERRMIKSPELALIASGS